MNKLPSFDELDNNESEDNFPSVDELLKEFEEDGDLQLESGDLDEDLNEPNFNNDFESFADVSQNESSTIDEDNEELLYDDDELDDNIEDDDNIEAIDDNEFESPESEELPYEDDPDGENNENDSMDFMGALLPGMESDSEIDSENEEQENLKDEEENEPATENGADEKVKEFFNGIKDKVLGLFKKEKEDSPKPKRIKKSKSPTSNDELKKGNKSAASNLNKNQKLMLAGIVSLTVLIIVILLFVSKSYSSLEDLNANAKYNDKDSDEKIEVNINGFQVDENLMASIVNESDISATISASLTFKEQSKIPFLEKKIDCESDIVHIETDGEVKQQFECEENIDSTKKYKVNAEIDKF